MSLLKTEIYDKQCRSLPTEIAYEDCLSLEVDLEENGENGEDGEDSNSKLGGSPYIFTSLGESS